MYEKISNKIEEILKIEMAIVIEDTPYRTLVILNEPLLVSDLEKLKEDLNARDFIIYTSINANEYNMEIMKWSYVWITKRIQTKT